MELTLFLENGKTFKFDNATILSMTMEFIEFSYVSMSTGKKKCATINAQKVLGLAISSEEGNE